MSIILEAKEIHKRFDGLHVLKGVNLIIKENTLHALIGPNGAGKTTFLNVINGLEKAESGALFFRGQSIFNLSPEKRAKLGIARTFQLLEIFGDLTALENIMVALFAKKPWSIFKSLLLGSLAHFREKELREEAMQLLSIVGLEERAKVKAKDLPLGEQKLLEVARALALKPHLLLLDEPAAGLNHRETRVLGETLKKLKEKLNLTILLVEHDMELVMNYSDWITVLNFGSILAEGTPFEIQKNSEVIKAYLGEEM